jgi:hypothetical protein
MARPTWIRFDIGTKETRRDEEGELGKGLCPEVSCCNRWRQPAISYDVLGEGQASMWAAVPTRNKEGGRRCAVEPRGQSSTLRLFDSSTLRLFDSSASACARGPRGARRSGLGPLSAGDHADTYLYNRISWDIIPR